MTYQEGRPADTWQRLLPGHLDQVEPLSDLQERILLVATREENRNRVTVGRFPGNRLVAKIGREMVAAKTAEAAIADLQRRGLLRLSEYTSHAETYELTDVGKELAAAVSGESTEQRPPGAEGQ